MIVRHFDIVDYEPIWQKMLNFTNNRTENTEDELWVLQHNPVFTKGKVSDPKHLLKVGDTPIIASDRGGQITYHGPGQLIIYCLLDLKRLKIGVQKLVSIIEKSIMTLLKTYKITTKLLKGSPGVYVENNKIAALGLRITRGCSMHGLSVNVAMDLNPFSYICPCGLNNIGVTQMKDLCADVNFQTVAQQLTKILSDNLQKCT